MTGTRELGWRWIRAELIAAAVAVALASAACGPLAAGIDGSPAPTIADAELPLVGTWISEITHDDLRAGGITEAGLLDENSGRFTWTFNADGTWTQVQESLDGASIGAPVFEGLYEVDGTEFIQRTTFPEEYSGDRLVFAWRIEDGSLHVDLTNPPDQILPVLMEAHPWSPATP